VLTQLCISRASRSAAFVLLTLLVTVRPASADITAFLGVTPTPENRLARGLAAGVGLLIVGFEGEYSHTSENEDEGLPGLRTWSGNALLQTPNDIGGIQLYGTAGVGLYRERVGADTETSTAVNLGGGIKMKVVGPLRLRLDYRVFRLQGDPRHQSYQRVYAGANLRF
jgi:opacity protein-like surface antigen